MSWQIKSIEEITEVVTKGTTPSTYGMPFTDDGINFIKAEALNGDVALDRSGFTFIDDETHEKLKRSQLRESDVLITIAGANVGQCGYVRQGDVPANTNQAVGIIRVKPTEANPRYIYYHFKQPSTFAMCQGIGGGQAAQPNINLTVLKGFKVRLPDSQRQDRVVEVIGSYDDLIENNKRRIELLEESARQLYKEWFVRFCFPGHEHVKIIDGVPDGWTEARVSDLGEVITGKTPSTKSEENYGGDVLFIKTPDMHGNSIVISTEQRLTERGANTQPKKLIPADSIMVSCIGTIGVTSINAYPSHTNQQINSVIPKVEEYRYFAFFALAALKYRMEAMGGGATMANVNKAKFSGLPILIPPSKLLESFHESVSTVFSQILTLSMSSAKLAEARDLLLPKLMSGEVAV